MLGNGVFDMIKVKMALVVGLGLIGFTGAAGAVSWYETEPMIWKNVKAFRGENPWSACQRYFRNDVTRVRPGPPGLVGCYVPYHYIYGYGQAHQNFNQ
jgi:hypothetical protein